MEEGLSRSTGLLDSLRQAEVKEGFHGWHRREGGIMYSDRAVWSPEVVVFRDEFGNLASFGLCDLGERLLYGVATDLVRASKPPKCGL